MKNAHEMNHETNEMTMNRVLSLQKEKMMKTLKELNWTRKNDWMNEGESDHPTFSYHCMP